MAYVDPYLSPLMQQLITPGEYDQLSALNPAPQAVPRYPSQAQQFFNPATVGPEPGQVASTAEVAAANAAAGAGEQTALKGMLRNQLVKRIPALEGHVGNMYWPGAIAGTALDLAANPLAQAATHLGIQDKQNTASLLRDVGSYAALGSFFGPEGSLVGGGLGAAKHYLFPGLNIPGIGGGKEAAADTGDVRKTAVQALDAYGIDSHTKGLILFNYDKLKKVDETTANTWLAGMMQKAQDKFQTENDPFADQQKNADLQLQQIAATAMRPYAQNMIQNYEASGRVLDEGLKNFTPAQQQMMKPLISQYVNMSKNVADAYALQTMNYPLLNQIAKSSMAVFQQQQSGGGGGGSLADILSAQTAANPVGSS